MTETEKAALRRLHKAVDIVRMISANLEMQGLASFLEVGLEEGQSIGSIGEKIGLSQSSASRNIAALSDWDWKKKDGLKLVEYKQDPMNLSTKQVFLTAKGRTLLMQLVNAIDKGGKNT